MQIHTCCVFFVDMTSFDMAYGPCWEPTMAQVNLSMNRINRPSVDPSRSLPFWDKFRVLLHGRLTMSIARSSWLYHASLDPYNTTEFMDWTWQNVVIDWTNGTVCRKHAISAMTQMYTQMCAYTQRYTSTHAQPIVDIQSSGKQNTHTRMHTRAHTHTHTNAHTRTSTHMHTNSCAHTHMHKRNVHPHAHTFITCMHTHTQKEKIHITVSHTYTDSHTHIK